MVERIILLFFSRVLIFWNLPCFAISRGDRYRNQFWDSRQLSNEALQNGGRKLKGETPAYVELIFYLLIKLKDQKLL